MQLALIISSTNIPVEVHRVASPFTRPSFHFSLSNFPKGRGAEGLGTRLVRDIVLIPGFSQFFSMAVTTWCYNSNGIGECKEPPAHAVASETYHDWSGEAAGARLRVNFTLKLLLSQNFCNRPSMRFISFASDIGTAVAVPAGPAPRPCHGGYPLTCSPCSTTFYLHGIWICNRRKLRLLCVFHPA